MVETTVDTTGVDEADAGCVEEVVSEGGAVELVFPSVLELEAGGVVLEDVLGGG